MRKDTDEQNERDYEITVTVKEGSLIWFARLVEDFQQAIDPNGHSTLSEVGTKSSGKCRAVLSYVPLPDNLIVVDEEEGKMPIGEFIDVQFPEAIGLSYKVKCKK